jgi:hypothetical protein
MVVRQQQNDADLRRRRFAVGKCAARATYSSGISINVWHVDAVTVSRTALKQ